MPSELQSLTMRWVTTLVLCSIMTTLGRTEPTHPIEPIAAEFEPQDSVWLIWPPVDHLRGQSNEQVVLQIIEAIVDHTKVNLTCADATLARRARAKIKPEHLRPDGVTIHTIPSVEFWVRDMGPIFVTAGGKKHIVDFQFDAWGYGDSNDADTQVEEAYDRQVAQRLGKPIIRSKLVSEGGDRESNGRGTLMVSESVELGRNPGMTKRQVEAEFARVLGIRKVLWLKQGLREDDHTFLGPIGVEEDLPVYTAVTTNGHVDEFARFVSPDTILLAEVPVEERNTPIGAENYRRLEENLQILKQARDQDGKPFRIVRAPLPPPIYATMRPGDSVYDYIATLDYQDGSRFPQGEPVKVIAAASYLNFLITNKVVVVPMYGAAVPAAKKHDAEFRETLESLFPNRRIVMIDPLPVNFGGGGIHCITMHEPTVNRN